MADDGVIRIGTEVDISSIKAGMAEAAATVKTGTSQMTAAYAQLAQATVDYAAKSAVLRDGIKQLITGNIPYAESVKIITPLIQEQTEASLGLKSAKELLANAARAEAGAQDQVATATRGVTSSYYAAQGAAGLLEGRIPFRAMERFIASSDTASSLLMKAFPVIGAVALAGVLVDVTEKVVKFSNEAGALGRELGSGWMDGAIAQLSGLSKGIKQADDEIMKLAHDNDEVRNRMQEDAVEAVRLTQGDAAATWLKADQIQKQINALESLKQAHLESAQAIDKEINSQGELDRVGSVGIENLRKQQDVAVAQYNSALKEQIELIQRKNNLYIQAQQEQQRQDHKQGKEETGGENSAARQQLQNIEIEFDRLNAKEAEFTGHTLSAADGAAFWAQYLGTFKAGSEEAKHVIDEATKNQAKAAEEIHSQVQKFQQEQKALLTSDEAMSQGTTASKWLQEEGDDILRTGDRWTEFNEAVARGAEVQAQAKEQIQLATINAREAAGAITKLQALHQEAAIHAADYAAKLKALNDQLERLIQEEKAYEAQNGGLQNPKNLAQQQQVKNQIGQTQGQANVSAINDQKAIQQQIAQPYLQAFSQIDDGLIKITNQALFSTRNISQAFAKMGQNMAVSAIDGLEKIALKTIEKEAAMTIAKRIANQQQVESDAQAAAQSNAITHAANFKDAVSDAKASAVKGWKAGWSFPPPLNIVMAPVLAAAALAGAMAQFEDGTGYVPRTGVAMLHEGEAVIPAPTMDELRNGPGGAGVNITQQNTFHGFNPDKEFQRQLQRNAAHVAGAVQRHLRQSGRG